MCRNAAAASCCRSAEGEAAGGHGGQHVGVPGRVDDDGDRRVVLGGGAHHRRAADVDLLDALVGRRARGHGLGERVEVDHDQVERRDAELVELGDVLGLAPVGQDPRVHGGVQRLHPAVEALGEAGDLLDRRDRDAGVGDPARGRAGAHQLDAGGGEPGGQLLDAGLVVDAQQRAADGGAVAHRELFLVGSAVGDELRHRLHQELALHVLDPFVQARLVVPGQDRRPRAARAPDRCPRPASTTCTVAPGHGHAGGQGVADGVRPRERRQQRGMGVDQPAAERVEDGGADDLHEAGRDDQVRARARRARPPARGPRRRGRGGRRARRRRSGRPRRRACSRPAASRSPPTATTAAG